MKMDFEEIKTRLFLEGNAAIEEFLGFELFTDDKDAIDNLMNQVRGNMSDAEYYDIVGQMFSDLQGEAAAPLAERQALCSECDSGFCVFSQNGECRLPLVTGCLPNIDPTGCDACIATSHWVPPADGIGVQENPRERAAFLWACFAKKLQEPKQSTHEIRSINGTYIHFATSEAAQLAAEFFNTLAGSKIVKYTGSNYAWLNRNVRLLRKGNEEMDPEDIWSHVFVLSNAVAVRKKNLDESGRPPLLCVENMLFFADEKQADVIAKMFEAIGLFRASGDPEVKDFETPEQFERVKEYHYLW